MADPEEEPTVGSSHDPLPEALGLAEAAAEAGLGLKLLGGLAVRVLCPDFPPRLRRDQDIDFACLTKGRKDVAAWLADRGCVPDRRFNNLNGDRQMYFNAPSGRPIDVMVDRLTMCHTLDFRPSFGRLPLTVDSVDVLLSKLQIVELNEKDARDIFHLLAGLPIGAGAPPMMTRGGSARSWALTGAGGGLSPRTWPSCPPCWPRSPGWPRPRRASTRWPRRSSCWTSRSQPRKGSSGSSARTSATGSAGTSFPRKSPTSSRIPGMRPKFASSA